MCYYYNFHTYTSEWLEFTDNDEDYITLDELCEHTISVNFHYPELRSVILALPNLEWGVKRYYGIKWRKPLPEYVLDRIAYDAAEDHQIRTENNIPLDPTKQNNLRRDYFDVAT